MKCQCGNETVKHDENDILVCDFCGMEVGNMKIVHEYSWRFAAELFAGDVKDKLADAQIMPGELDQMMGWPRGYTSHLVNLSDGTRINMGRFEAVCNILELDPRSYWEVVR